MKKTFGFSELLELWVADCVPACMYVIGCVPGSYSEMAILLQDTSCEVLLGSAWEEEMDV